MQKPLKKGKKAPVKAKAANRHGKITKHRKGKILIAPKSGAEKTKFEENKEITKFINERNLSTIAGVAAQAGNKLKLVQPPVTATAQQKAAKKK